MLSRSGAVLFCERLAGPVLRAGPGALCCELVPARRRRHDRCVRTPLFSRLILCILLPVVGVGVEPAKEPESPSSALSRAGRARDKVESTEVYSAHLQLTVYELQTTPEHASTLDAKALTATAATAESLLTTLSTAGKARILYRIDQPVNVFSENVQISTKEAVVSGTRLAANGRQIDTVRHQTVGIIVQLSAQILPQEETPKVTVAVELSALPASGVNPRNLALKHSERLNYDQSRVMLSISSASPEDQLAPVVYVVRYRFSAPISK